MSEMRLGERVKAARVAQQMTMAELAARCGLTKGFISQLESGASNPSLNTLRKIGNALKVPVTDLLDSREARGSAEIVPTRVVRPTILHEAHNLPGELGVSLLSSGPAGIHSLVTIPQGSRLLHIASDLESDTHGTALVTVLAGTISLTQEHQELGLPRGAVASWDACSSYKIEATGLTYASLVLFTPHGCTVPTYQENRKAIRASTPLHTVAPVAVRPAVMPNRRRGIPVSLQGKGSDTSRTRTTEGPLRLVAMRAQRLAERRGQS